jgi:predicted methyltransferase
LKNPVFANVKLVLGEQIAPPEKVDLIWTTQNYHDLHHTGRSRMPPMLRLWRR